MTKQSRTVDRATGEVREGTVRPFDGTLLLGYRLNDPERIVRDAVELVVAKAEEAAGVSIMRGRP